MLVPVVRRSLLVFACLGRGVRSLGVGLPLRLRSWRRYDFYTTGAILKEKDSTMCHELRLLKGREGHGLCGPEDEKTRGGHDNLAIGGRYRRGRRGWLSLLSADNLLD